MTNFGVHQRALALRTVWALATLATCTLLHPATVGGQVDKIKALPSDFGVPKSPAFELLPTAPDEVPHVVTPHDLQSNVVTLFQGAHFSPGASFDVRPFALGVGSLTTYQRTPAIQWLWRTVASVGTTTAGEDSKDILLAGGIRVPLIDRGDPRADSVFTRQLEDVYVGMTGRPPCNVQQPPNPDISLDDVAQMYAGCAHAADSVRKAFQDRAWGALRFDIGLAGSLRARGGDVRPDSLSGDRGGAWVGLKKGWRRSLRATLGGKAIAVRHDSATQESARYSAGGRVEWFATSTFSLSVEASQIWSRYKDSTALSESWTHPAVIAEWAPPVIGGWIGVAYGGDTSHRSKSDAKLSLHYAVYKDQILKK